MASLHSTGSHQTPYSTTRTSRLKSSPASAMKLHGFSPDKEYLGFSVLTPGLFMPNKKETMQDLNNRLASYLERVRALEMANEKLEIQIKEKLAKVPPVKKDYGPLFAQIKALRDKIDEAVKGNIQLRLQIDNAKLAANDYQQRWEFAVAECESYKRDLQILRKVKEDHEAKLGLLEIQLESLKDELQSIKETHKEELGALKASSVGPKVDVEVNAARGPDLAVLLADIRSQYEAFLRKNKKEAEAWLKSKAAAVPVQSWKENEALQNAKTELSEKQRDLKALQITLESLRKQVNALDGALQGTECHYANKLKELQKIIDSLEAEMAEVKRNIQTQKHEYETLFCIKETLEAEIEVYRRLLEGDSQKKLVVPQPVAIPDIKTGKFIKIMTQTLINGELVDKSSDIKAVEDSK